MGMALPAAGQRRRAGENTLFHCGGGVNAGVSFSPGRQPPYAIIRPMLPPLRHISPRLADRGRAARNFLAIHSGLLTCALFLLAGLALAGDYGVGPDDRGQRRIAAANLDYILGQADAFDRLPYPHALYGAAFELPLLLAQQALGLTDDYPIHRLRLTLTHLFFIVGAYFCYRLACRLFNNRLIALFALLIFLLHPRIYAHSFFNSKDLPFLSMLMIALYLLERAFRKDTPGAFILLGLAVGLLTNLRIMGAMLLPAVLALRGLDLLYAGDGRARKSILRRGGLFILAAGLTWYAVTPYAWSNPVDYLTTSLELTIDHPYVGWELFQGKPFPTNELPPHYAVTWFSITAPPLLLPLGLLGIALVAARGLRRPGAVFRNTRLRLQGLLLAAFLLPPLAAALLGSNQYDNWRHLYFLYAPFCLLAAMGGGWLWAALARRRRWQVGVYALVGAGLGLVLLQMAQIHPGQYDYFNFLVDRTTPERLRTQYRMDSWRLAYREGLAWLLERHPGATLVVPESRNLARQREILPPAARRRLPAAGGRADYELIRQPNPGQPAAAFNWAFRRQIYNNTLIAARPLDAARMTPAAIAAYRELYRQAVAGEPIIRADYTVYLEKRRLTFVRENCAPEERDARFGVRVFPQRPETLPPPLRQGISYALLNGRGVRLGRLCLAFISLPDYARDDLLIYQRAPASQRNHLPAGLPVWAELYSLSRPGLGELIADYRRDRTEPAEPGAFEVFSDRAAGRNRLLYAKADCTPAEYATPITLHIYPVNRTDLPADHRDNGFENRDFPPDHYGGRPGGECVAVVPLPDYPIAAIRTGQEGRWEVNLYPPADPAQLRADYAALSAIQPEARATFDLYWRDNRLLYLRETCAAADTAAGFFLHIIPIDLAALPVERQAAGFANLDFAFARWGGSFDGHCLAAVPLPNYPIKAIRSGQHIPGQGELWAVELTIER